MWPARGRARTAYSINDHGTATNPNVFIQNGKAVTSSQAVAEYFHKLHKDVLRKIESLECSPYFTERNFTLSEYTDSTGRKLPMYEMTKDGFVFLVMGFTGKKAAAFKEAYIGEFNRMESALGGNHLPATPEIRTYTITLTDAELSNLCWLWKVSDNLRKGAEKMYPGIEALGSEYSGTCYDMAFESRHTLRAAKETLCRETKGIEPAHFLWKHILPQIRQTH